MMASSSLLLYPPKKKIIIISIFIIINDLKLKSLWIEVYLHKQKNLTLKRSIQFIQLPQHFKYK